MYAYPNDKDRLKKHNSKQFRNKKFEEMEKALDSSSLEDFMKNRKYMELIGEGDLFNTTKFTYRGQPMYTIDYIIDSVTRQNKINDKYDKDIKEITKAKHGHWFFGLFH